MYEAPANQFVAGSIGSPFVNFFAVTVADGMAVPADGARLALPFVPYRDRAILGLRPEAMLPAEDLHMQVSLVGLLGSDTLAHVRLGNRSYVARAPPETRPVAGGTLKLAGDPYGCTCSTVAAAPCCPLASIMLSS